MIYGVRIMHFVLLSFILRYLADVLRGEGREKKKQVTKKAD